MDCPFYAEEIKDEASVCKHCGRDLNVVRPLLVANLTLAKRIDALREEHDALAESHARLGRHVGLSHSNVPSINRGSGIALLLLWIFVAGLFIAAAKQHGGGLSLTYATATLVVVPPIFGFLCQNIKTRPSASDLGVGLAVTVVAIVEIQLIRWELLAGYLIPQGWNLDHPAGELPPDTWSTLILNAATIFLGFSAGIFFRYLIQGRNHDQVTVATPISKYVVGRWGGRLSPAQFEEKIKRTDALIHSLSGIGAAGGALIAYLVGHLHGTAN